MTTGMESAPRSLIIEILPPWYLSTLAYIMYFIIIIMIVMILVKYQKKRSKEKQEQTLEKIEAIHKEEVYESKLKFFTNIAHDFCTPLTLIHGPCNRILTYKGTDSYVKNYASLILRNADNLNDLIQQLIEFRRIETGHRIPVIEKISVTDIVLNICDSFEDLAETRNIKFNKNIPRAVFLSTDKDFVVAIVMNLLSNAFKYTTDDGEVALAIDRSEDSITISIGNTGKGIDQSAINQVFDRYSIIDNLENTKKGFSRNGLGLAIANNLVKLLNGDISVESTPDVWTCFKITLHSIAETQNTSENKSFYPNIPVTASTQHIEPEIQLPVYAKDELKPTLLLIDDDKGILWLLCDIFSDDFNVIPIDSPQSIETLLEENHPDFIISDIMMPHINGISLVKQIKSNKETAHIPIILISAKYEIEEQIEGLSAGAEMYIAKPFNIEFLKVSVQRLMSQKETLKNYFNSPISAFELSDGKMKHQDDSKFLKDILQVISANIENKDLSVTLIASDLNMSRRHLYRKLREVSQRSPQYLINESRINMAANLLIKSKMMVDEIIYKVGFSNRGTFFKIFYAKYECTPKEYRDKFTANLGKG